MKTGSSSSLSRRLTSSGLLLAGFALMPGLLAAGSPAYAAAPAVAPAAATTAVTAPPPVTDPMPVLPAPPSSSSAALPMPVAGGKDVSLAELESHATDQAKAAVKRLNATTNDVNLDDLNSARMAIAKIDTLIDIEKHLAELEKVRNEREGKSPISAIPASALAPPRALNFTPPPVTVAPPMEPVSRSAGASIAPIESGSVSRITGANGNYQAVMISGGQEKTVRIGDHLADGSSVVNITPVSVSLMRNGAVRQVKVEGVDAVYGRSY